MYRFESTGMEIVLSQGDIVVIKDCGSTKWIVSKGWYTYNRSRCYGWYFKSIPLGTILPEGEVDLSSIILLSADGSTPVCGCGCFIDNDTDNKKEDEMKTDGYFVTVNTIEERNALGNPYPMDGKLVRVNDVKDETKYYVWSAEELSWKDISFGAPNEELLSTIQNLENRITELEKLVITGSTPDEGTDSDDTADVTPEENDTVE